MSEENYHYKNWQVFEVDPIVKTEITENKVVFFSVLFLF